MIAKAMILWGLPKTVAIDLNKLIADKNLVERFEVVLCQS